MKKSNDAEDIKVNKRSSDKVYFESILLQRISDRIDFLRDESKEILQDLDLNRFEDVDVSELSENTLDQISNIADDASQFRSEILNSEDFPKIIKEYSIDAKKALNRDSDYVRRAQRRLNNQDSSELVEFYKTNLRIIELCDKAIEVNSSNAEAYYLKGRALVNLDKYPQAIDEYINSLAIEDDVNVWIAIANANTLNGDYDDAINVYDSVLKKDKDSFEAIKGKALTYYACENYKKADIEFKKAAAIDSLDSHSQEIWDECLEKI
ncbi:tetratricopeptide repeat protein [uncultured Methanobrevibacter sp.]|uniref:tetratricopeptide repeat protein n=1 Tax=uncultured Methanobrevibacter sp. TaxID=253161 RepID=UPI0025D7E289|nr:tetratricopeptide repeat protein [uncultured Methanobrevibacter sp.]